MVDFSDINLEKYEFLSLIPVDELPSGERIVFEIDQKLIILFNIDGKFYAIEDVCSHDQNPLDDGELVGFDIHCPRHGASFDVRSGKVTSLPATDDIMWFPTRIENNQIQIGLPKEKGK